MFENAVVIPVKLLPSIAGRAPVSVVAFNVPFTLSTNTVESAATTSIDCVEPAGNTELVIALSTSVFVYFQYTLSTTCKI